jgi:hypothetical protein
MVRWIFLAIVGIAATAAADDTAQKSLAIDPDVVLTAELRHKLSGVLAKHGVPGYALAVVRPSAAAPIEYANWGNATEDGRPMESNVRAHSPLSSTPPLTSSCRRPSP